ncbi:hypothetical protein Trydic_g6682 [Trypoxylus dichotomus]
MWEVGNDTLGSDHYPIFIQFTRKGRDIASIFPTSKWNIKDADWQKYSALLKEAFANVNTNVHARHLCDLILRNINTVAEKVFKVKKPRQCKRKEVCWWDYSCDSAIFNRKDALQRYRLNPSSDNFVNYKTVSAQTKRFLKSKARNSWREFCEKLNRATPANKIWQVIRAIKAQFTPRPVISNEILSELLHKLTPNLVGHSVQDGVIQDVAHVLLEPFTDNDLDIVLNDSTNSAPGMDNILYPMIQHLPISGKR